MDIDDMKKNPQGWILKETEDVDSEVVALSDIFKVPESITSVDNHIYFYSEVDRNSVLSLNKKISEIERGLKLTATKFGIARGTIPIYLHINSYGGQVHAAMAGVDKILNCSIPIITIVEGCAASAATLLSVVGKERYMSPHSCMLIHEMSSMFWGKYHELIDEQQNQEMLMEIIYGIYKDNTKIPRQKLKNILKKDMWWNADTCLEYGLIDEIGTGK